MKKQLMGGKENYYRGLALVAMALIVIGTYFVIQTNASILMCVASLIGVSLILYGLVTSLTLSSKDELENLVALLGLTVFSWTILLLINQRFELHALVLYFVIFLVVIQYMDKKSKLDLVFVLGTLVVTALGIFYIESILSIIAFATVNMTAGVISYMSSKTRIQYLDHVEVLLKNDLLTGLANRRGLYDFLDKQVVKYQVPWAILYIDLKKFRTVNTIYGQAVGDQVLIDFKNYLERALLESDYICRINGNEFVVLLKGISDEGGVASYLKRLGNMGHFTLPNGEEMHFGMGVSFYSVDATSKEDLLMTSNIALQAAKEEFGNAVKYYNQMSDMSLSMRDRIIYALENQLEETIRLAVQPIKSMTENDFTGFEALARMVLEEEVISPMEFIPLAESLSLIHEVDTLIMEKALAFLHTYKTCHDGNMRISVNVSKLSLNQRYIDRLSDALKKYKLSPSEVLVEITETKIFTNKDEAVFFIHKLRKMGFNVAMDDFGSGYTSLAMIQSLPINVIKLDKSLIQGEYADVMVKGLLTLLDQLGLESIVEGVETEEQLSFIESTQASYIQGYLIDRPQMVHKVLSEKQTLIEKVS